ncbi:hypothetical protein [uncultured Acinetobacter sp.]|uniref:hypothetical protein n=1 Tax=uncultured Acinetobacter sp. TaxID=165433 RepID=UPI002582A7D5|nr:hypothetical protein [uncultured Acinetobacter sp.]
MTCKSCEERREWMKQQYERAKARTVAAIKRITGADAEDSGAEHNTDSADSEQGSDHSGSTGAEQRTAATAKRTGRRSTKIQND